MILLQNMNVGTNLNNYKKIEIFIYNHTYNYNYNYNNIINFIMSTEQYTSSILSHIHLFEWHFQIPIPYSENNLIKLSCISISVEEARKQIMSMLIKFEHLAGEKQILDEQRKQQYKSQNWIDHEMNYYGKLKQMYQCYITYKNGCRDSSIDPRDYTCDIKVINGHVFTYSQNFIRLEDLIKTIEPTIKPVNLVSFHVGN